MDNLSNLTYNHSVCNKKQKMEPRVESIGMGNESLQYFDKYCYLGGYDWRMG